ncbi:MAG TPA: class I adenylate-forming enzyme family protein [Thermoanaerobaculia bacterium]|jgi:long-chain acyl-CoA synthetase|nr:class I adenylate-forming enzyme family protein [Thermoanaerobaculia bacterium]
MIQRFLSLVNAEPGAPALIDGATGAVTTRADLWVAAERFAASLSALRPRDGVAVRLPNSVEFVAAILAAAQRDLVVFPIDRDTTETELATILGHFGVRGLIYRSGVSVRETHARPNVPAAARLVKLTSGSTGMPKGIVATDANLIADAENICSTMDIRPDDVNLGAIPFSHSYGFSNLVMPLLVQGTPVVVSNDYLPQSLVDLANEHRCTVAPLIPMVFEHLANAAHGAFATIRTFLSAGAPLAPSTSRKFRERYGLDIHSFYGCSECGGITYDRRGAAVERGTVGTAMEGVTLKTHTRRLSVRSGSVAAGYLFDANTFEPFPDRTFVTDDLVELRDDGEVSLTGRASDLINTAGKKVNPREVEAVLLQIEGVREAKVYGEAAGARGEVVAAAIVATPNVSREQVREFCRARLSLHKVPRIIKIIDEMPVDERGKVRRAALASL